MLLIGSSVSVFAQTGFDYAQPHIQRKASEFRLTDSDIKDPLVTDAYQSKHNGVFHVYLKQTHNQIPVYNATMNLNLDKMGGLLSMHSRFVPELKNRINTTNAELTPQTAIQVVSDHLGVELGSLKTLEENSNPLETLFEQNELLRRNVKVSQIFYLLEDHTVRLAWNVDISIKDPLNSWEIQVDAINGTILNEISKTHRCNVDLSKCDASCETHQESNFKGENAHNFKSNAEMLPNGDYSYNVFQFPLESPNHGSRSLVIAPWNLAGSASTMGWHNDGDSLYTYTRGNNVWARYNVEASTYYSTDESSETEFNYPFGAESSLSDNQDAAITNLFYVNNVMHDVLYQYGFDEVSGNFQHNNQGNGGEASDYVIAGAQDLTGTNNALFDTPIDGENPEMQMFIWFYSEIVKLQINNPASMGGVYSASPALFGPRFPQTIGTMGGDLVLVENQDTIVETIYSADSSTVTQNAYIDTTNSGCNEFINAGAINGKIAMVERGNCLFADKVRNAQAAGAIACVVCNNDPSGDSFVMSGEAPDITIPSMMVSKGLCDAMKGATNAINISLYQTREEAALDGAFDNGIVSHEYGHGLSMRLTGGPSTTSCLGNSEQMGEGWSDWVGLWMTMEPGDSGPQPRGMGTYANNEEASGQGLRLKPYSTDFAVNSYTYDDLCNPEVLAPHGVGFIWGTMLWDLTWAFVDRYGFDADLYGGSGGNNLAAKLIIDGMKLQPCSPGFVDGRDAILLADEILTGGQHACLIWEVFAKRGLGYGAQQGSSYSRCDQVTSFDVPEACTSFEVYKTINLDEVFNGDVVEYVIEGANNMDEDFEEVVLMDVLSDDLTYVANSSDCPVTVNGQTLTFNLGDIEDEEGFSCSFKATVQADNASTIRFFDGAENGEGAWTIEDLSGNGNTWTTEGVYPYEGFQSFRTIAPAQASDQILAMKAPIEITGANPQLIFRHFYLTEFRWDFGIVEISTDNGTTWQDLGSHFTLNGYNDTVDPNSTTAFPNRAAFTGNSGGYLLSSIDLSSYINEMALIRFRLVSDDFVAGDGWLIDNVMIADVASLDNTACIEASSVSGGDDGDGTGDILICSTASAIIAGPRPAEGVRLQADAFLQGSYDAMNPNFMRDDLTQLGFLPQVEPYQNMAAFQHVGSGGGETISTSIVPFPNTNNNFVDWVMLELRSKSDSTEVVATKGALITRNGKIVNGFGDDVLLFEGVPNGDYYLSIRHRNHLGIMVKEPVFMSNYSLADVDFTNPDLPLWGIDNGKIENGKRMLWACNVNQGGEIIFQGMGTDINDIFFEVLSDPLNTGGLLNYIIDGYSEGDVNMDGKVIYQGLNNDPNEIFFLILMHPNNQQGFSNFVLEEQIPQAGN